MGEAGKKGGVRGQTANEPIGALFTTQALVPGSGFLPSPPPPVKARSAVPPPTRGANSISAAHLQTKPGRRHPPLAHFLQDSAYFCAGRRGDTHGQIFGRVDCWIHWQMP